MSYEIRFFFDAGSGICLWSGNEEAIKKYGYPIDHWKLPLSENTKRKLEHLVAWFDTSLDWSNPSNPDTLWDEQETLNFNIAIDKSLKQLRQELPEPDYKITNET